MGAKLKLVGAVAAVAGMLPVSPAFAADAEIEASELATAPVIDGLLDDEAWDSAAAVAGFVQFEPEFGAPSVFPTEVRVGFTSDALYVAFRCTDSDPKRIAASVTSRDGDLKDDDSVTLLLDTNRDRRTAYYFATNVLGVQADGKVADNGRVDDDRWDAAWRCAARLTGDGWSAEFEIPFRMLRFESGDDVSWGVNFRRRVPRQLETSLWSGPSESVWRVSEFGALTGLNVEPQGLKRFAFIPYGLVVAETGRSVDTKFGGDVRIRVSSNLSADLTANPDFALIEADVEEINLSRYELKLPEKRPFFLEGLEMFKQRITQFYSRRIGDISAGGKMVGVVGGFDLAILATRADVMLKDEDGVESNAAADYTVLRLQRGVFGPSTVGLLAANRRTSGVNAGSVGADTTLFFTDTLGMTAQILRAHGPTDDGAIGWFLRPSFDTANSHFHIRYTSLDVGLRDNVNAIGFLKDDDRREWDTDFKHTFWFDSGALEKIKGDLNYNRYSSQEGVLRSEETDAEVKVVFSSRWEAEFEYVDEFRLEEQKFDNSITSVKFGFDNRAGRSIFASYGVGRNFGSDLQLAGLEFQYRLSKAWDLSYEATWLELDPDPDMESTWIHVLRSSYYFTNDLYVSLFLQTNSVISKENVQLLGVWRFKPPFGSLQIAYQRGTSEFGKPSEQGDTLFSKLSWVF